MASYTDLSDADRARLAAYGITDAVFNKLAPEDQNNMMQMVNKPKPNEPGFTKNPTPAPVQQIVQNPTNTSGQSYDLNTIRQAAQGGLPQVPQSVKQVGDMLSYMKQQVQTGNLSVADYQGLAAPLLKNAQNITEAYAGKGADAANQVNPYWQQLQTNGFLSGTSGQWKPTLPFSTQEFAQLPNNVLPTQDQVQRGIVDPSTLPQQRFRSDPATTQPPTNTPAPQPNPGVVQPPNSGSLVPTNPLLPPGAGPGGIVNPNQSTGGIPGWIDTSTDQGKVELAAQRNAAQLQSSLDTQQTIQNQALQQYAQSTGGIPDLYNQQGVLQQQQQLDLAGQQDTARKQALQDLGGVLATNQMNLFNRAIPDLAEQANTSGIYRSTGFGDILARKFNDLTQDTQTQLALQGISDRDSLLSAQTNALNTRQGYQGQGLDARVGNQNTIAGQGLGLAEQYAKGLQDVANTATGMQNSGLQRSFSLADYAQQANLARQMAQLQQPQSQGKTTSQKVAGGAQVGSSLAQIGSLFV